MSFSAFWYQVPKLVPGTGVGGKFRIGMVFSYLAPILVPGTNQEVFYVCRSFT